MPHGYSQTSSSVSSLTPRDDSCCSTGRPARCASSAGSSSPGCSAKTPAIRRRIASLAIGASERSRFRPYRSSTYRARTSSSCSTRSVVLLFPSAEDVLAGSTGGAGKRSAGSARGTERSGRLEMAPAPLLPRRGTLAVEYRSFDAMGAGLAVPLAPCAVTAAAAPAPEDPLATWYRPPFVP